MSILTTPTPDYQGSGTKPSTQPTGLFGWLTSLFQTRTPAYKTLPESSEQAQKARQSKR
jgi:hypothetical protein